MEKGGFIQAFAFFGVLEYSVYTLRTAYGIPDAGPMVESSQSFCAILAHFSYHESR